ncbi:hypothetical protein HERIO_1359 [Hepatospora eriocheir]|uniref:Uncharacterized protein n=1 Tax=Hepatospora eriocheir TaxID=1081669 RepID=A0A1X0QAD7_9MICR|nr:hypothetical protein HERIO_1359 [Hepatospora eriocheir]
MKFKELIEKVKDLSDEEIIKLDVDLILKNFLKESIEINKFNFDQAKELVFYMKDSRNIYDELIECLYIEKVKLDALMLIFELVEHTDFEFDNLCEKLTEVLSTKTKITEELLYFIIQVVNFEVKRSNYDFIEDIITYLLNMSIDVNTPASTNIIYTILTCCRIYPNLYLLVNKSISIKMLYFSFNKKLIERIYIEANNDSSRPKNVFLNNFCFPKLKEDLI